MQMYGRSGCGVTSTPYTFSRTPHSTVQVQCGAVVQASVVTYHPENVFIQGSFDLYTIATEAMLGANHGFTAVEKPHSPHP